MMKKNIFGLFLTIFLILFFINLTTHLSVIFNGKALFFVILLTSALSLSAYKPHYNKQQILKKIKLYFMYSGILGVPLVMIVSLSTIVHGSYFGPAAHFGLLSLFYGILFSALTDTFIKVSEG